MASLAISYAGEWTRDLQSIARTSRVTLKEVDCLDTITHRLLYFAKPVHLDLGPLLSEMLRAGS